MVFKSLMLEGLSTIEYICRDWSLVSMKSFFQSCTKTLSKWLPIVNNFYISYWTWYPYLECSYVLLLLLMEDSYWKDAFTLVIGKQIWWFIFYSDIKGVTMTNCLELNNFGN